MTNYTELTVFENTDTINEPVISIPMLGRLSFRQIGIAMGTSVLMPLVIYSALSGHIHEIFPEPIFTFDAISGAGHIRITWDVMIALIPVPIGLALGLPRPKLMPMDTLLVSLASFAIRHTSIQEPQRPRKTRTKASKFAGFAQKDSFEQYKALPKKRIFTVGVSDLGTPKNITITLYDSNGEPIRNSLARAYVDDVLLSTITTDSDGVMGMTFAPQHEGVKNLVILVDGFDMPVVDVGMDVRVSK